MVRKPHLTAREAELGCGYCLGIPCDSPMRASDYRGPAAGVGGEDNDDPTPQR